MRIVSSTARLTYRCEAILHSFAQIFLSGCKYLFLELTL
jgi:hypothetical protein